jgi:hypothetical protein
MHLRARREENLRQRAEQLALHEEKKRLIAEWIAAHGTLAISALRRETRASARSTRHHQHQ